MKDDNDIFVPGDMFILVQNDVFLRYPSYGIIDLVLSKRESRTNRILVYRTRINFQIEKEKSCMKNATSQIQTLDGYYYKPWQKIKLGE